MPKKGEMTERAREMLKVVQDLDQSGMTVREYAQESGHKLSTLWHWRRQLRQLKGQSDGESRFIPVTVLSDAPPSGQITIETRSGRRIHVPLGIEPKALKHLIQIVEAC